MKRGRPSIEALTLDAYGTLLALERPFERLRESLAHAGIPVSLADAERAFLAEMAHYRDHHLLARDAASLEALRRQCAAALFGELSACTSVPEMTPDRQVALLMQSVRFALYDDVAPLLAWCREHGVRLAVVSNWDFSLADELARLGLAGDAFEVMSVSALVGAAKPAVAIFRHALDALGLPPEQVLHVGDEWESDLGGPTDAGMQAILLDRRSGMGGSPGRSIRSLGELPALLSARSEGAC